MLNHRDVNIAGDSRLRLSGSIIKRQRLLPCLQHQGEYQFDYPSRTLALNETILSSTESTGRSTIYNVSGIGEYPPYMWKSRRTSHNKEPRPRGRRLHGAEFHAGQADLRTSARIPRLRRRQNPMRPGEPLLHAFDRGYVGYSRSCRSTLTRTMLNRVTRLATMSHLRLARRQRPLDRHRVHGFTTFIRVTTRGRAQVMALA